MTRKRDLADKLFQVNPLSEEWTYLICVETADYDGLKDSDFRKFVQRSWKELFDNSEVTLLKQEKDEISVRLLRNDKDLMLTVERTPLGNVRGVITSLNGYCCRFKQKNIHFRIEIVEPDNKVTLF